MTLEEVLKKRKNISFFDDNKIPDKKIIEEILEKAHHLTPHKNNFWDYEIEVYGPNYDEEKKYVAMSTVCSSGKTKYTRPNTTEEDFKELESVYDKWIKYHHNKDVKTDEDLYNFFKNNNKIHFNNQVRAPYLLVYTKREKLLTDSQINSNYYKTGKMGDIFKLDIKTRKEMWLIQAGMHGIITSSLAIEKGLNASFCKCFFYNTHLHSNILRKAKKSSENIAFLLGIGYPDENKKHYYSNVPKPLTNEIIKWK